jgi:RNA polymerase sigma-B factor
MASDGHESPLQAVPEGSGPPDKARQELVRSHLPLVRAMARRYGGRGEEFDDLVQVGALGLVRASGRFDPGRGVAFATFAAPAVEGEIRRHLRERSRGLRLPRETQRMSTELKRCEAELASALGRSPTVQELAAALDADVAEIERLIAAALMRDPVAMSAGDAAAEMPDAHEPTTESETRLLLASGLRALDERERRIVFLRFHADMTEQQIARAVGVSQAHVSRLLDVALAKLRNELTRETESSGGRDSTQSAAISPDVSSEVGDPNGNRKGGEMQAEPTEAKSRRPSRSKAASGYSGRILVRMPSELHEQLAQAAEREDVSLNRYVTQILSSTVDPDTVDPDPPVGMADAAAPQFQGRTLRLAVATNFAIVVVAAVTAVVLLVLALHRGV